MAEVRLLTKDEIEVRVHSTSKRNIRGQQTYICDLLLYKDARCDMRILDELYGPEGWQRKHELIGDRLYCIVSVYHPELKEWISKEDVGTESNTEAEKGQASDSFKRACVNWGIGRELYTAPRISIPLVEGEFSATDGRVKVWQTFKVARVGYNDNREIIDLVIVDKAGKVRYSMKPLENEYRPVSNEMYRKFVKAQAEGKKTATGLTAFERWCSETHAGEIEQQQFLEAVTRYLESQNA